MGPPIPPADDGWASQSLTVSRPAAGYFSQLSERPPPLVFAERLHQAPSRREQRVAPRVVKAPVGVAQLFKLRVIVLLFILKAEQVRDGHAEHSAHAHNHSRLHVIRSALVAGDLLLRGFELSREVGLRPTLCFSSFSNLVTHAIHSFPAMIITPRNVVYKH